MKICNRDQCHIPQDPDSPLYLCKGHQSMVDSKRLGWDDDYRANHNPPMPNLQRWKEAIA